MGKPNLLAKIISPQDGVLITGNTSFPVEVVILNEGDSVARFVDVACVLNGGWRAGKYPGRTLAFVGEASHGHKNLGEGWPPPGLEAGESANLIWNVICKIAGNWIVRYKEQTDQEKEKYQNGWVKCQYQTIRHPKEDYQNGKLIGKAKIRINLSAVMHIGKSHTINFYLTA